MKSFKQFVLEKNTEVFTNDINESQDIRNYLSSKVKNATMNKFYLVKAPNGKPLLFKYEKIVKNETIIVFGTLEYGKIIGQPEWYFRFSRLTTTNNIKDSTLLVIDTESAKKIMKELGIAGVDKIPVTKGLDKKDLPDYEVAK